jgi:hypothetical protein
MKSQKIELHKKLTKQTGLRGELIMFAQSLTLLIGLEDAAKAERGSKEWIQNAVIQISFLSIL